MERQLTNAKAAQGARETGTDAAATEDGVPDLPELARRIAELTDALNKMRNEVR